MKNFSRQVMKSFYTFVTFICCIYVLNGSWIGNYCRMKNRLIASDELDEYLLVDVELNSTLRLDCHYCDETNRANDDESKIWYYYNQNKAISEEREVDLGMNNNSSENRIFLNAKSDLVIRQLEITDVGIYKCRGFRAVDTDKKFNYRLEFFPVSESLKPQRGSLADWEQFREINFIPVTARFKVSQMGHLALIRDAGVILEIISEWSNWGPCLKCIDTQGIRRSKSLCRLKRTLINTIDKSWDIIQVRDFFNKSPMLPCRSVALDDQYPVISMALRNLPEFMLEESCKNCKRVKKIKLDKFKYKKRFTILAGSHLSIVCPESDLESVIVWRRNGHILKSGTGYSFGSGKIKDRVIIDTFSTLYFHEISIEEKGNYTCYVNNVKMLQAKVDVLSQLSIWNRGLLRHMGYLGFIVILSSFCYCGGLVVVCYRPKKFSIKEYKDIVAEKSKKDALQRHRNWMEKAIRDSDTDL